ncbi:hypothetical protein [Thioalkalivibrio sp. HK1]|uniref:hypothetical protein n=1 Tax=Thioalkalivibrio sp. HK1 TaxID=1469245 RepID=UPI0012DC89DD|nr:hypothetical protein [Thioalkalivibrio sp. HK1]
MKTVSLRVLASESVGTRSVRLTLASTDSKRLQVSPATVNIDRWSVDSIPTIPIITFQTTITLTAVHDGDTGDERIDIRTSYSHSASPDLRVVRINDDDDIAATGTIQINPAGRMLLGEGRSGTFQVTLSAAPNAYVRVDILPRVSLTSVSPSFLGFSVTNWGTAKTVTVTAAQDDDGLDHNEPITLSATGGFTAPDAYLWVEIDDDEEQGFDIDTTSLEIDEPGTDSFGVRLATRPSADMSVTLTTTDSNLTVDTDPQTAGNQTILRFNRYGQTNAWNRYRTVNVALAEDDDALDERLFINFTGAGGDYAGKTGSLRVDTDDPDEYGFDVQPDPFIAVEGQTVNVQLRLTAQPQNNDTYVRIAFTGIGHRLSFVGESGSPSFITKTFKRSGNTNRWDQYQTIPISVARDPDLVDETPGIRFSALFGETDIRRYDIGSLRTLTVHDTEKPTGSITAFPGGNISINEGASATISARLTESPYQNATIHFSNTNPDVTISPTSLNFNQSNYSSNQSVTVTVAQDSDFTDDTDTITLITTGTLRTPKVTRSIRIADDDNPQGTIEVAPAGTLNMDEGDSATLSIKFSTAPKANATISLSKTNSDVRLSPASLTFTPSNYSTAQTVTVSVAEDSDGNNESDTITLTASGGIDAPNVTKMVSIDDDEPTPGTIELLPTGRLALDEGESGTFSVRLGTIPEGNVTVLLSKTNSDITLSPTSLTFTIQNASTAQMVTVSAAEDDDGVDDSDTITLAASGGITAPNATKVVAVNDDEPRPGTIRLSPAGTLSVDEGESNTFSVRFDATPRWDVTVSLSKTEPDITLSPASLTFTPSNHSRWQMVTVSAAEDDDAADDTDMITLTASGGIAAPDVTKQVTVDDDEQAAFDLTTFSMNLIEGEKATFGLRLASRPLEDIRVSLIANLLGSSSNTLTVDADPDEAGNQLILDFNRQGQTKAWDEYREISLFAAHDSDKKDESFRVVIAEIDGDYPSGPAVVKVTVSDDDADKPSGSIEVTPAGALSIDEGESQSLSVSLDTAPTANVTLSLLSLNEDLSFSPASLTFTASNYSTAQSVSVAAADDADAVNDSATIVFRTSGGIIASDATKSVTIIDDDEPPGSIEVTPAGTLSIDEGRSASLSVSLSTTPRSNVTVSLSSSNSEVTLFPAQVIFTPSNHSIAQSISITAAQDSDTENDSATITLEASGGIVASNATKIVAVIDDDNPQGTIELAPAGTLVMGEGRSGTFMVSLGAAPKANVTVLLSSSNSDLTLSTNSLTFTPSNHSSAQTIQVTAAQDSDVDDDSATITLEASGGIDAPDVTKAVAIIDDDKPSGTIELAPAGTLSIDEGASGNLSVSLDSAPSGNVTISLASSNPDVTLSPSALTFTVSNHSSAQTVRVAAAQDTDTVNDSATITLRASGGIVASDARKSVTVIDDDSTVPTPSGNIVVSPSGTLNVDEGESGRLDIHLSVAPNADVTVLLSKTNPNITLTPTSLTFIPANYQAVQSITVAASEDADAVDDTDTLTIEASGGIIAPSLEKAVTIFDDDPPPHPTGRILLSPAGTLLMDEGGGGVLSVSLSAAPDAQVTIVLSSTNADVTLFPTTLTFTPSNHSTAQSVSVSASQDADAVNDSGRIDLRISGAITASDATKAFTVIDDESSTTTPSGSIVLIPSEGLVMNEGGSGRRIDIRLSTAPDTNVTVLLSKTNSNLILDRTSLIFTPSNYSTTQTVNISTADDIDALNYTDTITLEASGGIVAPHETIPVTVIDDDFPLSPVQPTPVDGGESLIVTPAGPVDIPEGRRLSLFFRLANTPPKALFVNLASRNGLLSLAPTSLVFTPSSSTWASGLPVEVFAIEDSDADDGHDSIDIESIGETTSMSTIALRVIDNDRPEESPEWEIKSRALAIPPPSARDSAFIRIRCNQDTPCKVFLDCSTQAGRVLQGYLPVIRAQATSTLVPGYLQERFGLDGSWEGRLGCALRSEENIGSQIWTRSGDGVLVNNSAVIRSAMAGEGYRADIESIPSPDAADRSNIRIRCDSQQDDCSNTVFVCYLDEGQRYEAALGIIPSGSTRHLQSDELVSILGHRWPGLGLSCEVRSDGRFTAQILTRTGGGGALVNNSATGE